MMRPRTIGFGLIGMFAAATAYAGTLERRWLEVTHHHVPHARLPGWQGMRIAHLTDFHIGAPGAPDLMIKRAVRLVAEMHPDIILLTGDYTDDGRRHSLTTLAPLACTAPTFAVLGNHDYFQGVIGASQITEDLTALGITVLRDEASRLIYNGVTGSIIGFDSRQHAREVPVHEMVAGKGYAEPSIALVHVPDVIEFFPPNWAGLTLSGHTHGAQIRLSPIRSVDWVNWAHGDKRTRFPRGWFTVRGNLLYVNRGLGVAAFPLRLGARPEIACLAIS